MFRSREPKVSISIVRGALESIFDECDQYDIDETGGRLVGSYTKHGSDYDVRVSGVIGPGPNAHRSSTSFFQDGHYQETIFRSIESQYPTVEHLGNWHTHHVNGYSTLSGGDKDTYFATVNHHNHNTDFFYALLVTKKNPRGNPRYVVRHYFFRRNDDSVHEIPSERVQIVDAPLIWPTNSHSVIVATTVDNATASDSPNPERTKDQEFFSDFYPDLKPMLSKKLGALYWKGSLTLVDGSRTDVIVMEDSSHRVAPYSVALADDDGSAASEVATTFNGRRFRSARHAVFLLEREVNQAIYRRSERVRI